MKNQAYLTNIILSILVGIACLLAILFQAFSPSVILPEIDIPLLVGCSTLAMIAATCIKGSLDFPNLSSVIFAAISFSFLPLCANLISMQEVPRLFLNGILVFATTQFCLASIAKRLPTGSKFSFCLNALLFLLATQVFSGLLL